MTSDFDHLAQQVVAFARAFADAREDGEAGAGFRDIVNQLHDDHGLATPAPPKSPILPPRTKG